MKVKTWDVLIMVGIALGIIGCFSPWGRENPTMFHPWQDVRTGTFIFSGIGTFVGLMSAAMFQLIFMFKRKVYMIFAVLISGLVALFVSGSWILQPVAFEIGGVLTYTVLYGAYVTLLGVLVVSAMAFLYIAVTAEKQLRLRKLKEET